jgi:hypothetical protein
MSSWELVGGAVADPHRAGAAPALEVVQCFLTQVRRAVHPVHDLQRMSALVLAFLDAVAQPAPEPGGFLHIAQPQHTISRQRPR